jgi:short subunit dehydrogenase
VTGASRGIGRALALALALASAGAGVGRRVDSITAVDDGTWRRTLAVNLDGAFYCPRAAIPRMLAAGGGRIVNISSGAAAASDARPTPCVGGARQRQTESARPGSAERHTVSDTSYHAPSRVRIQYEGTSLIGVSCRTRPNSSVRTPRGSPTSRIRSSRASTTTASGSQRTLAHPATAATTTTRADTDATFIARILARRDAA